MRAVTVQEVSDLRHLCGPIRDQLPLHSCSAHAVGSLFEFFGNAEGTPIVAPSRLFLYYNERESEGTLPADDGATLRSGLKCAAAQGFCSEGAWPYDARKAALKPDATCYESAIAIPPFRYLRMTQELKTMQGSLNEGYAFVFGVQVYQQSFAVAQRTGTLPVPLPNDTLVGGHAMLAVGFDARSQTFTAQNSLGVGFGNAGFLTLPSAYLTDANLAYDFWTIRPKEIAPSVIG